MHLAGSNKKSRTGATPIKNDLRDSVFAESSNKKGATRRPRPFRLQVDQPITQQPESQPELQPGWPQQQRRPWQQRQRP